MKRTLQYDQMEQYEPTNIKKFTSFSSTNKEDTGPQSMKNMDKRVLSALCMNLEFKIRTNEWRLAQPTLVLFYHKKNMKKHFDSYIAHKLTQVTMDRKYNELYTRQIQLVKNQKNSSYDPSYTEVLQRLYDRDEFPQDIQKLINDMLSFNYLNDDEPINTNNEEQHGINQ